MPGTMSIFTRNCGTVKLCSTSFERSSTLTGLSIGQVQLGARDQDVVAALRDPPGSMPKGFSARDERRVAVRRARRPRRGSGSSSATAGRPPRRSRRPRAPSTNLAQTNSPGASIAATPTEVTTVSHHSSFLFSGSYSRLAGPCGGGTDDRVGEEQVDRDEHDAGDPERDVTTVSSMVAQFDAIGVNHQGLAKWKISEPMTRRTRTTAIAIGEPLVTARTRSPAMSAAA